MENWTYRIRLMLLQYPQHFRVTASSKALAWELPSDVVSSWTLFTVSSSCSSALPWSFSSGWPFPPSFSSGWLFSPPSTFADGWPLSWSSVTAPVSATTVQSQSQLYCLSRTWLKAHAASVRFMNVEAVCVFPVVETTYGPHIQIKHCDS